MEQSIESDLYDRLLGAALPSISLPSTRGGTIDLGTLSACRTVIYCYPRTSEPNKPAPTGWDVIPGARGCTPQACTFRDHYKDLAELRAEVFGLSTATVQSSQINEPDVLRVAALAERGSSTNARRVDQSQRSDRLEALDEPRTRREQPFVDRLRYADRRSPWTVDEGPVALRGPAQDVRPGHPRAAPSERVELAGRPTEAACRLAHAHDAPAGRGGTGAAGAPSRRRAVPVRSSRNSDHGPASACVRRPRSTAAPGQQAARGRLPGRRGSRVCRIHALRGVRHHRNRAGRTLCV